MAEQRTIALGKVIEAATNSSPAYPAATVTGPTPTSGAAAGGTAVSVAGTGLSGCTAVLFDGVPATAVTVVSDVEVTCATPAGSAGAVDVVVVTPAGAVVDAGSFTYT